MEVVVTTGAISRAKLQSNHQYQQINTTVILSSNKIQNGDLLVPANPGPPAKWLLKRRE